MNVRKRLQETVDAMQGVRVGVVGDLVADVYVHARPHKLSREAPVVIARHEQERVVPGGGANVLANLASLGGRPTAMGTVGDDADGERLLADLDRRGVDVTGVLRSGQTVTLTRYMVGSANTRHQQVLRIDRFPDAEGVAPARMHPAIDARTMAGWVASDYGYGAIDDEICSQLARLAAAGLPVIGDSRWRLDRYRGFTLVKPNLLEAETFLGQTLRDADAARIAARQIAEQLGLTGALLTMGNQGMVLATRDAATECLLDAVGARSAIDVSGAGDTVCAVLALAVAAGADLGAAAVLANRGASVVVMKEGTTPLSADDLRGAIDSGGDPSGETDLAWLMAYWEAQAQAPSEPAKFESRPRGTTGG